MSLPVVEAVAVMAMSVFLIAQARRLRRVLPRSPRSVAAGLGAAGGSGLVWKGGFLLQGVQIPGARQASDGGEATTAVITTVVILFLLYGCYRMAKGMAPESPGDTEKKKRP